MGTDTKKLTPRNRLILCIAATALVCLILGGITGGIIGHRKGVSEVPVPQFVTSSTLAPDTVVGLEIDGKTTYCSSIQMAVTGAGTQPATLHLIQNTDESFTIANGQDITLDFGEKAHKGVITNRGTLTIVSGVVGTVCNDISKASMTVTGGSIESVNDPYDHIVISGGVFTLEPDQHWIADGYIKKDNPDPADKDSYPYLVEYDCVCVMTIGDETTAYASVYDAINAATNKPATVLMKKDYLDDKQLTIEAGQNITLDCGYYTLSVILDIEVRGGDLTFINGIIDGAIMCYDGSVTVLGGEIVDKTYIPVKMQGGTLTMCGGTLRGWLALQLYQGCGTVTVSGGEIIGEMGAISNDGAPVFVTGGCISGQITDWEVPIVISGGVFSNELRSEQIAERFSVIDNADADTAEKYPYTVLFTDIVSLTPANGSETKYYRTLGEALKAADNTAATVGLDTDIAEDIVIASGQNITLDVGDHILNGKITVNGVMTLAGGTVSDDEIAVLINGGTFRITGGDIEAGIVGVYIADGVAEFLGGIINSEAIAVWANSGAVDVRVGEINGKAVSLLISNRAAANVYSGNIGNQILSVNGSISLSGGQYAVEPNADYVSAGFNVVKSDDTAYPYTVR